MCDIYVLMRFLLSNHRWKWFNFKFLVGFQRYVYRYIYRHIECECCYELVLWFVFVNDFDIVSYTHL